MHMFMCQFTELIMFSNYTYYIPKMIIWNPNFFLIKFWFWNLEFEWDFIFHRTTFVGGMLPPLVWPLGLNVAKCNFQMEPIKIILHKAQIHVHVRRKTNLLKVILRLPSKLILQGTTMHLCPMGRLMGIMGQNPSVSKSHRITISNKPRMTFSKGHQINACRFDALLRAKVAPRGGHYIVSRTPRVNKVCYPYITCRR